MVELAFDAFLQRVEERVECAVESCGVFLELGLAEDEGCGAA